MKRCRNLSGRRLRRDGTAPAVAQRSACCGLEVPAKNATGGRPGRARWLRAWGGRRAKRQLLCRPADPRSRIAPCARSAAPAAGEGREAHEAGEAPSAALPIPAQGALCGRAAAGPHVLFVSINSPLRGLCIWASPCLHSCAVPRGSRGLSPRPGAATEDECLPSARSVPSQFRRRCKSFLETLDRSPLEHASPFSSAFRSARSESLGWKLVFPIVALRGSFLRLRRCQPRRSPLSAVGSPHRASGKGRPPPAAAPGGDAAVPEASAAVTGSGPRLGPRGGAPGAPPSAETSRPAPPAPPPASGERRGPAAAAGGRSAVAGGLPAPPGPSRPGPARRARPRSAPRHDRAAARPPPVSPPNAQQVGRGSGTGPRGARRCGGAAAGSPRRGTAGSGAPRWPRFSPGGAAPVGRGPDGRAAAGCPAKSQARCRGARVALFPQPPRRGEPGTLSLPCRVVPSLRALCVRGAGSAGLARPGCRAGREVLLGAAQCCSEQLAQRNGGNRKLPNASAAVALGWRCLKVKDFTAGAKRVSCGLLFFIFYFRSKYCL